MTEEPEEEKYRWMVMFVPDGKIYPYAHKTFSEMAAIIKKSFDKDGRYPHRIWAIVNDEVSKVEITS